MMNQQQKTIKEPKFIFPKKIAQKMRDVPQHIQMESSMLATTLLLFGLIAIAIQQLFTELSPVMKGMIIFNIICGMVIMGSTLITSYQQYHNYIMTMGIDLKEEKKKLKLERKQKKEKLKAMKLAAQLQKAGFNIQSSSSQQPGVKGNISPPLGEGKVTGEIDKPAPVRTDELTQYPSAENLFKVNEEDVRIYNKKLKHKKQQRKLDSSAKAKDMQKIRKLIEDERRLIEEL
jgi:hypothetical protein